MWGRLQKGLDFDRTTIPTINIKLSYFHEHFVSHDHNGLINDIEIIFIDKTDSSDPTWRDEFCRAKLKTLESNSLNIEE